MRRCLAGAAPGIRIGEHSDAILNELVIGAEAIALLRDRGAVA